MLDKTIEKRRSIYSLGKKEILTPEKIIEIIEHSVKHCPTAFNSQSSRAVVLFGKNHERIWDIVLDTIKAMIPAAAFKNTENKINGSFKSGYGTILFFEDQDVVKGLQEQFPSYKGNFPVWSEHANAMLQYVIWTSLAENKVGASLQHYNPIIDDKVKSEWNLPISWKLISQMPFGSIESPAGEKDFSPIEERIKIFK